MKEKSKIKLVGFLSSFLILSAPSVVHGQEEELPEEPFSLRVFHTNDIHASIDDFPKMAYYLEEERANIGHSLFVDAGDIFSGNPVVDLLDGTPMIELLNEMNLDVLTIGNHEFDYGQTEFQNRRNESNFEWISANTHVVDSSIEITQPKPFEIFTFDDVTVGILGLTEAPPATNPAGITGLEFSPYIETALSYSEMRDEVDIFIALTHIGFTEDQRLAEAVDFFDVIIGGHSHTALSSPRVVNGTPIVQSGSNARNIGVLDITLDEETGEVLVDGRLQPVGDISDEFVNQEVQSILDGYNETSDELLSEVLGYTETGLNRDARWERDVSLGNMITDALRHFYPGVDIAITNNGGIRASIEPGDITARDIFTVDPFGNTITVLEMTGHDLKDILAYSYHRSLNQYGPQIDLQTSGLNYIIYTDEDGLYADSELFLNGEPMNLDETYTVATNNFIVTGGDGYNFEAATIIQDDAGQVTNALMRFVTETTETLGAVNYEDTEGRIQVLPLPLTEEPVEPEEPETPVTPEQPETPEEDGDDTPVEESPEEGDESDTGVDEDTVVPVEDNEDDSTTGLPEEDASENNDTEHIDAEDNDSEDDLEETVVSDENGINQEAERLPDTATVTWTIGLIGLSSATAGTVWHIKKRNR